MRVQKRPWESLRSTTFKRKGIAGIEPDDCFYIQNYRAVIGKDRLDLAIDPPPDLTIESDVTSKTETEAYTAIKVPELWVYGNSKLMINLLQNGEYVEAVCQSNLSKFSHDRKSFPEWLEEYGKLAPVWHCWNLRNG